MNTKRVLFVGVFLFFISLIILGCDNISSRLSVQDISRDGFSLDCSPQRLDNFYLCELSTITSTMTLEPSPTQTPVPSSSTPSPTIEPTNVIQTPTPTATSIVEDLFWHLPSDHHHGVNPDNYPELEALFQYMQMEPGQLRGTYIKKEASRGDVYLYADASEVVGADGVCDLTGTEQYIPEGCIQSALLHIHNVGHEKHSQIEDHTAGIFGKGCLPDGSQCGYMAAFVLIDYGTAHCPYKQVFCSSEYDQPMGFPLSRIDQPPYRTSTILTDRIRSGGVQGYWVGMNPNAVILDYYPPNTNSLLNIAWRTVDAFQYLEEVGGEAKWVCGDFLPDTPDCKYNASEYQVVTIRFYPPTDERPFLGYIHPNGTLAPECGEPSEDCYILYMSEDLPVVHSFEMNRFSDSNNPETAPIYEFCPEPECEITRP